jgi:hypothetical protein
MSEANLKSQRKTKNLGFNTAKTQCVRRVLYQSVLLSYLEWYYNPINPRMRDRFRKEFEELKKNI